MDKPTPRKRILVVEDERHISEGIRVNLQLQGYDVKISETGPAGLSDWKHWQPDLVVLDIMLPGIDGITVLKSIRLEDERLPILILSAKGSAEDRVNGLANGVDDYLSKPFNLDEFLLRIDRLLKRDSWLKPEPDSAPVESLDSYSFGSNKIDFKQALAFCKGQEVSLTEQELRLLRMFIANRGKVLSRGEILETAWGFSKSLTTRTVDNFVARFRKYFEDDPKHPEYFKSRRSVGYVFDH
ncbi:response regulator transcription factor [Alkalimarinus sediminis]|uniref:Response regulator transcription factor n=1 Tax=Alkalimarinus sediminis TaxID=1632866 RepID=A0A9E8HQ04_9ALTE|nr:response regulator transcription factor [Alkalimarinus sediminis]UZW74411.1 response regulator transcription factor [Alkalimarinus sediminis]